LSHPCLKVCFRCKKPRTSHLFSHHPNIWPNFFKISRALSFKLNLLRQQSTSLSSWAHESKLFSISLNFPVYFSDLSFSALFLYLEEAYSSCLSHHSFSHLNFYYLYLFWFFCVDAHAHLPRLFRFMRCA